MIRGLSPANKSHVRLSKLPVRYSRSGNSYFGCHFARWIRVDGRDCLFVAVPERDRGCFGGDAINLSVMIFERESFLSPLSHVGVGSLMIATTDHNFSQSQPPPIAISCAAQGGRDIFLVKVDETVTPVQFKIDTTPAPADASALKLFRLAWLAKPDRVVEPFIPNKERSRASSRPFEKSN